MNNDTDYIFKKIPKPTETPCNCEFETAEHFCQCRKPAHKHKIECHDCRYGRHTLKKKDGVYKVDYYHQDDEPKKVKFSVLNNKDYWD